MKNKSKWLFSVPNDEECRSLANQVKLSLPTVRLLVSRGYSSVADIENFIYKKTECFHDPFLLPDMEKAVLRLNEALGRNEKITVYGDYDVDGVTSVATLYTYLKDYTDNLECYIPDRTSEGYGLNSGAIERIASNGTKLIITVDCGITAVEEIEYARQLGIDVIITDHHECGEVIPDCVAAVNPKRPGSKYPFPHLAGVGVVLKLCTAHAQFSDAKGVGTAKADEATSVSASLRVCTRLCDLVCIGTIADVMPITDENRIIVTAGLHLIPKTKNIGLRALVEECRLSGEITSSTIGFMLAPRINAAGRMQNAREALDLFLTSDTETVRSKARLLCELNVKRQSEENNILNQAIQMIENDPDILNHKMIVLGGEGWHQGVVGIVCSRLTEKYYVPTILISFENGMGKGSGRSIPDFNLFEALNECKGTLERYGGHSQAAGLSLTKESFEAFSKSIIEYADKTLDSDITFGINADIELSEEDITDEFISQLSLLEPYGVSNPTPLFLMRNVKILSASQTVSGKHVKLMLDIDGNATTAMYFGTELISLPVEPGECCDILFNLSFNEYKSMRSRQLIIREIRQCLVADELTDELYKKYDDIINRRCLPTEEYIPNKSDAANVFRALKTLCTSREQQINMVLFSKRINCNMAKAMLICDVLNELNIISLLKETYTQFRIALKPTNGKTPLENSELYNYLRLKHE